MTYIMHPYSGDAPVLSRMGYPHWGSTVLGTAPTGVLLPVQHREAGGGQTDSGGGWSWIVQNLENVNLYCSVKGGCY